MYMNGHECKKSSSSRNADEAKETPKPEEEKKKEEEKKNFMSKYRADLERRKQERLKYHSSAIRVPDIYSPSF
jgi:hypothetical protein